MLDCEVAVGSSGRCLPIVATGLMILLGIVGLRLAVLGEPPDNQGRTKAQGHADRHTENTPKSIHNLTAILRLKGPK